MAIGRPHNTRLFVQQTLLALQGAEEALVLCSQQCAAAAGDGLPHWNNA